MDITTENSKAILRFGFDPQWTDLFLEIYNKTELKRNNREQIQHAFTNSQVVVSVWIDGKPVAVGRAISDFKMYSSIFDVVVDPEYQKMGLGKKIMQSLLERLAGTLVYLTSTFGNEEFYKQLGFRFHKSALAISGTNEGYAISSQRVQNRRNSDIASIGRILAGASFRYRRMLSIELPTWIPNRLFGIFKAVSISDEFSRPRHYCR